MTPNQTQLAPDHLPPKQAADETDRINALEAALIAARPLVAMTLEEARKERRLLYCQQDPLNPCWNGSWSKEHGVNKHWGGDEACPECKLRAAIAVVTK